MDDLAESSREKLADLFQKINHPLVDVRSRALKSLLFKLQNGLVSTAELIHERQLLIHLLEWFNFNEWSCETHALSLLCQLSEHDAAAETLVSVGATEFLTQLRPHLKEEPLRAILDDIMENLLKLPKAAVANQAISSSSSSVFSSVSTSDVGSYAPTGSSGGWRSRMGVATTDYSHNTPEQHLEHAQTSTPTIPDPAAVMVSTSSSEAGWMQQQQCLSSCSSTAVTTSEKDRWIGGWSQLPWLQLAIVDTQVIATTVNRLQTERGKRISDTCQFVCDVLVRDFPAELFLQRPAIVQALLSLLTEKDCDCCVAVLECLEEIVRVVRKRVKVMINPLVSGMGDRRSVDNHKPSADPTDTVSEASALESFSSDALQYLVSQQLTLINFSCSILLTSIPLLLHHLHVCLSWLGEKEDANASYTTATILQLVTITTDLLVTVCQHQKEEEMAHVNQLLECLASTTSQCVSKLRRVRESTVATEPLLQVLCPVTTVLTNSLAQIIHTTVPVDQADAQLSSDVSSLIRDLATAPVFTMSLPYSSFLLPYLKLTNPSYYKLYTMEARMADSFNHLSAVMSSKGTQQADDDLAMVSKGLQGLYFHCNNEFVNTAVSLCMQPLIEQVKEARWKKKRTILLSLLAHGSSEVVKTAYECVKTNWSSAVPDAVHSLCDDVFVRELLCHGVLSSRKEVAGHAHILLSQLLDLLANSEGKWTKETRKQMMTLLPYIEACLSSSSCICLRDQVLSIVRSCSLPHRLYSYIRMLYSSNHEIRPKAFSHLSSLLLAEDESMKQLLLSAQSSVTFHNILQSSCLLPPQVTISTKFKAGDVSNLIAVISSATLESSMRASALEQLIIVLHDYSLHSAALECGLLPLLTQSLKNHHQAVDPDPMVPSCLSCLTLLAHSSPSVRDSLLHNESLVVDTIKCVLSYPDDSKVVGSCTRLLACLSFSSVAQYTHSPNTERRLALPEQLLPHLQFPFPVDPLVAVSPHHIPPLLDKSLLLSDPVQHRLSIRWIVSAHNGIPQTEEDALKHLLASLSPDRKACVLFDLATLRHSNLTTAVTTLSRDITSNTVSSKASQHLVQLLRMTCLLPCSRKTDHSWEDFSLSQCVRVLVKQHLSSTRPHTPANSSLLSTILSFLFGLLSLPLPLLVEDEDLVWLVDMMAAPEGVCVSLLHCDDGDGYNDRTLQLAVLKLLTVLLQQCNSITNISISSTSLSAILEICHRLLLKAAIPDHHDLSLLHHTLSCLLHTSVAARDCGKPLRPEWISNCFKLLTSLQEVLWMFITGRGTVFSSFMGKEATRQSALILSHLLHTLLSTNNCTGEWLQHWVLGTPPDENMTWLHSLLTDRETEVRCAGYSILSLLCSQQLSAGMAVNVWQGMHSFGLWGACVDMALHDKESSLVKEQVLCVLSNLMCHDQQVINALLHYQDEHGEILIGAEALDTIFDQTNMLCTVKSYLDKLAASVEKAMNAPETTTSNMRNGPERDGTSSDGCLPKVVCSSHLPVLSSLLRFISNCAAVYPHLFNSNSMTFDLSSAALGLLSEDWLRMIIMAYNSSNNSISLNVVCVWVELYCSALRLLQCLMRGEEDEAVRLVGLLHLRQQLHNISKRHSQQLCCEVVSVITALSHKHHDQLSVFSALVKHWHCFAGLIIECMESASHQLMKGCLKLLCSLLVFTKPSPSNMHNGLASFMSYCLDQEHEASKLNCMSCYNGRHYSGKSLATVLIHQSRPLSTRREEDDGENRCGDLVESAISLLVASSQSAKQAALDAGLIESTIERAMALLTKIRQQSVGQHRQVKKSSQLLELTSTLELMRNLLYQSSAAKKAALSYGLVDVLHTLWPTCSVRVPLLQTVVSLLCVLIASYQPAHQALVSPAKHCSTSLLHSIIKMAVHLLSSHQSCINVKTVSPHLRTLDPIFSLLATSSLSHEGRGALKKTGFLSRFVTLNPKQEKHSSHGGSCLSSMWLRLLVCITFSTDGQAMFIRQTGSVELVCDIWAQQEHSRPGGSSVREQCALLLRNCCFYGPAKSILATDDQIVGIFSQCLQCEQLQLVSVAATAIWALLHNCTKLRGQLAHAQLPRLLRDAAHRLDDGSNNQIKCSITNALSLLQQKK